MSCQTNAFSSRERVCRSKKALPLGVDIWGLRGLVVGHVELPDWVLPHLFSYGRILRKPLLDVQVYVRLLLKQEGGNVLHFF